MKIIRMLFVFFIFIYSTIVVFSDTGSENCWIHMKVNNPNNYLILSYFEERQCCYWLGYNCIIKPCIDSKLANIQVTSGGYLLKSTLEQVKLSVREDSTSTTWTDISRDGKNYPFTSIEYVVIDDCSAYPALNNRLIPLQGITTDANGQYTVFIPSGNY